MLLSAHAVRLWSVLLDPAQFNFSSGDFPDHELIAQHGHAFLEASVLLLSAVNDHLHRPIGHPDQRVQRQASRQIGQIMSIVAHGRAGVLRRPSDLTSPLFAHFVVRNEHRMDAEVPDLQRQRRYIHDRDPIQRLAGMLIPGDDRNLERAVHLQIPAELHARLPGPDDDGRYRPRALLLIPLFARVQKAVREPDGSDQQELEKRADQVVARRHAPDEQPRSGNLYHSGNDIRQYDPVHVIQTGIPPHAPVKAADEEDKNAGDRIVGREGQIVLPKVTHAGGEPKMDIKACQERQQVSTVDHDDIQQHNPQIGTQAGLNSFQHNDLSLHRQ